jgi:hypothetical protein
MARYKQIKKQIKSNRIIRKGDNWLLIDQDGNSYDRFYRWHKPHDTTVIEDGNEIIHPTMPFKFKKWLAIGINILILIILLLIIFAR